ncbi:hypothetical protein [Neisseria sicca]|uniref:hypothetical protein n=1 Tax=Neisseria sicca TaxID=490 RepID=UPI0019023831|nr:hypothetical protein [Neisseria sicca]
MPELTWQGKAQVKLHHLDVPFQLLNKQYDFHAAAGSTDNRSDNILIHGDNLLALKSLLPEFGGPWIRISSATLVYQWFEQIQE